MSGYLPIDEMVKDAEALARQFSDGSNPIRDTLTADVICHVKAMAAEIEQLRDKIIELATIIRQHLHQRRCRDCGSVAWHADRVIPYVTCKGCGSNDTRPLKEVGE